MKRAQPLTSLCVAGVLSTGLLSVGCGRSETPDAAQTHGDQAQAGQHPTGLPENGQDLTVTGCLTANIDGSSYALTPAAGAGGSTPSGAASAPMAPAARTYTYELVGNVEDFRRHANTMVTVRGRTDASVSREVEHEREAESTSRPSGTTDGTPTVEVKEEAEVQARRLHATSVVSTGETCPSLGATDGRATSAPGAPGTSAAGAAGGGAGATGATIGAAGAAKGATGGDTRGGAKAGTTRPGSGS